MVPKKAKSKRISASQRYKIDKRIKEHRRKQAKLARLSTTANKKKKDPGIPNLCPFKSKLLKEVDDHKQRIMDERSRMRSEKVNEMRRLEMLVESANERTEEFSNVVVVEQQQVDSKDDSRKAYQKTFRKVVERADVILEILDARDPLGCRCTEVEQFVSSHPDKRLIIVLNKIDLVPMENTKKWLEYLRNHFPTVAFKASTQQQRSNLGQINATLDKLSHSALVSSECFGAQDLMRLLKNYCRNANIKSAITVGVIGSPNVGKSSIINSLVRARVCASGNMPGVTRAMQEISLDKHIKLLDCPGIVFTKTDAVLRNSVKIELIDDPIEPVEKILARSDKHMLMNLYQIPAFMDVTDFLIQVARVRGRLRRGGVPDLEGTARSVLQDWNCGRIMYYSIPPAAENRSGDAAAAAIVSQWAKEFDIDGLVRTEKIEDVCGGGGGGSGAVPLVSVRAGELVEDVEMEAQESEEDDYDSDEVMDSEEDESEVSEDDETPQQRFKPTKKAQGDQYDFTQYF